MAERPLRSERIKYAEWQIIRNPYIGKRELQRRVKAEFGLGLSDTVRRDLLRKANAPTTLLYRINSRAFYPSERRVLKEFLNKGNPPYLRDAINHRWQLYVRAREAGVSRREYRQRVRREHRENGWIVRKTTRSPQNPRGRIRGQIDMYAMIKHFRDRAIDRGDYFVPPVRPKTDKGDIAGQKARRGERESAKRATARAERRRAQVTGWIDELKGKIKQTKDPRRKDQLTLQLRNLERTLRTIK